MTTMPKIRNTDVLLIEAMSQFEGMSAALKVFMEGGEPTVERAKATLEALREHIVEAADALQALEFCEAGLQRGVRR